MSAHASESLHDDPLLERAQRAAAAAARELPQALIIAFDEDLRFVHCAGAVLDRLGDPERCAPGHPLRDSVAGELWPALEPLLRSALAGETRSREIWSEGRNHCLTVDVGPLGAGRFAASSPGHGRCGVAVLLDATARRFADTFAHQPEDGFEEVFERAPVGTGLLDMDGRWLLANRALCEMTGYTAEELTGMRFEAIVHPEDAADDAVLRARLLAGELPTLQVAKRYFDAGGETGEAILSMSLVRDRDGAPMHFIVQLQDVSKRRRLEEQLARLADRDPLTGLRSRNLFECDLELQIARAQRYGEVAGLLLISVADLRDIDERHGHGAGDEVLRAVARVLARRLRRTDLLARLRGGEFAVLLPHVDADGMAVVVDGLSRVIAACGADVGHAVLHPHTRIGALMIDATVADAHAALAAADRSMRAQEPAAR